MPGWKRDVGRQIDAPVTQHVLDVRKAVRYNTPFYGATGDDGWFLAFHCMTKYVKVTFFRGTSLGPVPPEPSKVDEVRSAHLFEGETIDDELWSSWIRQAAALPGGD